MYRNGKELVEVAVYIINHDLYLVCVFFLQGAVRIAY